MSRHIVISTFALYDLTLWFWAGRGQCISILLYDILIHNAFFFIYIYLLQTKFRGGYWNQHVCLSVDMILSRHVLDLSENGYTLHDLTIFHNFTCVYSTLRTSIIIFIMKYFLPETTT